MFAASPVPGAPGAGPASVPEAGRRYGLLLLALVVATSLPFWGKAFHIDDPFFIAIAENLKEHPLRPFGGAVALDDTDHRVFARLRSAPNTFETLSHPPLVPYVIAAVAAVSGGIREVPQHAAFLLFSLAAVWFQYRLARRFTPAPFLPTLLLASCPLFMLGGQSVMTDVPALALFLAGLALFVEGVDSGDARRLLLAGAVAGLAVLTRYVCLGLLPLGALYVLGRRKHPAMAWLALVPFGLVLGLWCFQNLLEHGGVHLAASLRHYGEYYEGRYFTTADLGRRAMSDLAALGGTTLPLAVLLAVRLPAGRDLQPVLSGLAASAVVWLNPFGLHELREYGFPVKATLALFLAAGVFLLVESVRRAFPLRADRGFLLLWLLGGLVATVVLLPFGAARYMIPVLPPLILLLCGGEEGSAVAPRWTRSARGVGVAGTLSVVLGLLVAIADWQYANVYREFAQRGVPAVAGNHRVWFIGDWGFRYYMEKAGHRYLLSTDETPTEGDFIVRPQVAALHLMAPGLRARTQRELQVPVMSALPIRVMSYEAKAGYYSHGWGLLPLAISWAPLESFEVFRVIAPPS